MADATGLNNTGLIVRTWGKVTRSWFDYGIGRPVFYLDDGSGVLADIDPSTGNPTVGVKVCGWYHESAPPEGSYQAATGVSGTEWPDGYESSIRVVRCIYPGAGSTQPSSGTISGTITGTGADSRTVRVY